MAACFTKDKPCWQQHLPVLHLHTHSLLTSEAGLPNTDHSQGWDAQA